jgi:exosome complex RNA-binding protein Csl4
MQKIKRFIEMLKEEFSIFFCNRCRHCGGEMIAWSDKKEYCSKCGKS